MNPIAIGQPYTKRAQTLMNIIPINRDDKKNKLYTYENEKTFEWNNNFYIYAACCKFICTGRKQQ